ncbi:MAG: hypothetical protein RIB59_08820 [Rhodospirillales bacterium]
MDSLLSPKVYEHAFFARPAVEDDTARQGWEETYALYHRKDLRAEIEEAKAGLAGDLTAEAMERFRVLKRQEQEQRVRDYEG